MGQKLSILHHYGGIFGLLRSKYLWVAAALTSLTYSAWTNSGWWDLPLEIIPNLLGFTLGGFALTVAFGDEKFREILAKSGDDNSSVFKELAATFYLFIAVQLISLLSALVAKYLHNQEIPAPLQSMSELIQVFGLAYWFLSYLAFIYGLLLSLAAAKWIFMLAITYSDYLKDRK